MKAFAFGQWLTGSKKAQKVDSSYEKILLDSSWRVSGISLGVERKSLGTEKRATDKIESAESLREWRNESS